VVEGIIMKKSIAFIVVSSIIVWGQETYYYKNHKKETLVPVENFKRSLSSVKYYKNTRGIVLGVSKNLILKIDSTSSLQKYINTYNLVVLKQLSEGLYLLKNNSKMPTLDVANQLTLEQGVTYAHPDFIKKIHKR